MCKLVFLHACGQHAVLSAIVATQHCSGARRRGLTQETLHKALSDLFLSPPDERKRDHNDEKIKKKCLFQKLSARLPRP